MEWTRNHFRPCINRPAHRVPDYNRHVQLVTAFLGAVPSRERLVSTLVSETRRIRLVFDTSRFDFVWKIDNEWGRGEEERCTDGREGCFHSCDDTSSFSALLSFVSAKQSRHDVGTWREPRERHWYLRNQLFEGTYTLRYKSHFANYKCNVYRDMFCDNTIQFFLYHFWSIIV